MASSQNSLVATLIANPSRPVLTDEIVALAATSLGQETERSVLARGIAADLIVPGTPDAKAVEATLRRALAGQPIDIVVQPTGARRKRLFLADMDSTMIGQECIDELADYVGLKREVSEITERAMRGEIAFEPALRERVSLLRNLPVDVVDEIIEKRITLTPGGRTLVQTMRAHGAYACLVSGGFTLFTGPIAAKIGFNEHRSNHLILDGEKLAGQVEEPILGREAKLATLVELRARFGLAPQETMAVGDGANDLAMLAEAGLGVAFHAKPAVAAAAHARIAHADLSALLYVQGYRADEFVDT
ncbi:phosphoserine phosphatase SerB [Microvirga lotononidis]|uniref:Phosphoserine phosphatase n=1 Tax=Microvirga lotononidis TaxID=864069 RepID=I4YVQ3_9HYPH|nr:phosphoserine phosphatase SerB [Microvirga lotononidis]EIM28045.1 phosphoserine phosphatase SerB [Microvirga lotononidis]WQO27846.1 phosphoserine phosphatase SerB [Microvirga lotononidis]